ncbi:hypothetical protein THAOC_03126, partial [Thalassiosira oceanica]
MVKFFHILSFLATTAVKGQEQLLSTSNNETYIPTEDADAVDEQSTPICADGEELFRLQLKDKMSWGFTSYRIFTDSPSPASDTEIHAECVGCTNYFPGADVQLCLPKDQCHTTAVGRNIGRWGSCSQGEVQELVMTWGGEIIHQSNAYLFASVDFGDGCQDYKRCDDGETEFEFFLDRNYLAKKAPAFSWELNRLSTDGSEMDSAPLHDGKALEQSLPFVYERLCVPRSCLQFSMGYPSNTTEQFYDPSPYSIRRDGAIIAEKKLEMKVGLSSGDKLNQTVNLGESCTASTACDPRAESLVELDITVNAERKCPYSEILSSAVPRDQLNFKLFDEGNDEGNYRDYYVWSGSYADFEIDTLYTYIGCIPKDRCVKLIVGSDNFPASYKVYQDGVEMTKRVIHREGYYEGYTATDLGDVDVCSSGSA